MGYVQGAEGAAASGTTKMIGDQSAWFGANDLGALPRVSVAFASSERGLTQVSALGLRATEVAELDHRFRGHAAHPHKVYASRRVAALPLRPRRRWPPKGAPLSVGTRVARKVPS